MLKNLLIIFLKLALAFFFSFALLQLEAQAILQGEVKSVSGGIIPNASVEYLHHKIGCMANSEGKFVVEKIIDDTVRISSIGYSPVLFAITNRTGFLTIFVSEETKTLSNVFVANKGKKVVNLGFYSSRNYNYYYQGPTIELAVLIPNDSHLDGYIKEIKFKLSDKFGVSDLQKTPYRLCMRIRGIDPITELPSDSLLYFVDTLCSGTLKKLNRISVFGKNIRLPTQGVFVSYEWLFPESKDFSANVTNPYLAGSKTVKNYLYFNSNGNGWQVRNQNIYKDHYGVPNIGILVSVPKN